MYTGKLLRNISKALLTKPSANPFKCCAALSTKPHFQQNPTTQRSDFCTARSCAPTVCENADKEPNLNDHDLTTNGAEIICKLVSEIGSSRNLDSAFDSANLTHSLSPNLVLQVLRKLNNAGTFAFSFFRWAEKQNEFQHTPECYNALIESLGKIKQFKMVWLLVGEMKGKGLLCKDTFVLICRRYARAKNVDEAIEAFRRMESKYGLIPELQDYNRLLDTLTKSKYVEKAQEVFDKWKKDKTFAPDIKSYTILLEGWGQECNFLRLDEVCREMKEDGLQPDVVIYGILIKAHCKAKQFDRAVDLYHEMKKKNIKATPHIYCTLINAFGSEKRLDEAIKFFELCKGSSSDCVVTEGPTYNAMVGAYCWANRISDAYKLMDEMRRFRVGPTSRTYDIILHHLVKLGRTKEAYGVFRGMDRELGCEPTGSTYEIMLRMFCSVGPTELALGVWDRMKERGVIPSMQMFSALIDRLCLDKRLEEACKYFMEMLEMGIRPPDRMFRQLKQALVKEGKEDVVIVLARRIEKVKAAMVIGD